MVYEARYLARNCELKTRLGDIVSHLRHLSHLSQDKTKLLFSFFLILFNYAIQGKLITWLVNSALNCTWKPISHSSLRDSCDIGFRVQFNTEFPRQVMNFPIELDIYNSPSFWNKELESSILYDHYASRWGVLLLFMIWFFLFCVQIDTAEREEKKDKLVDAGFNLSHLKVVATDYFKVIV